MAHQRISDLPSLSKGKGSHAPGWGSDFIVEQLSRLHLPYIALVPGSSYRGIHDSLVNYNNNDSPQMLICLHEEHAIALAHGYAKVTEKPLAAGLHANVGLMHASMAIYNAFCDRVPMVIMGATGPLDAMKRRPWIDWLHTALDQGALIRPFVKFDDQPLGINSAVRSLVKATASTIAKPCAPVYVCMDVGLQEGDVDSEEVFFPDTDRYMNTASPSPSPEEVKNVAKLLSSSKKPLFLFGRLNRSQECWDQRVKLVELFEARVITDIKQACCFPTTHKFHPCPPSLFNSPKASEMIKSADLIISFDWVDLAGALGAAHAPGVEPSAKIVHVSLDSVLHNGWSKDHFDTPPADISLMVDPDKFLTALLAEAQDSGTQQRSSEWPQSSASFQLDADTDSSTNIFMGDLASSIYSVVDADELCLIRLPLSWRGSDICATHPLSTLGADGGYGIGSGPGQAVGAALALKDTSYLPVAVLGDGDYLMSSSALWTATRYRIPLLVIVSNNGSYYNDEVHQERMANARGRPVENKWIGQRLDDPLPDLGKNAESLGVTVLRGQVKDRGQLKSVLREAVKEVREGKKVVLVDVKVMPYGYASAIEKGK
jgi:thiamine pyrophosphate-dependent acetolactate synthase large subunit-like protein